VIWRREDAEAASADGEKGGRAMAEHSGDVTVIGQGAKLDGTVVAAGSLRIDGQVKGQINAEGDVMLSSSSQVEADIRSQNVSVAGRFRGSLIVKGKAELTRGGRVDGNVTCKTLVVEEGAILQGQCIMDQQAAAQAGAAAPAQATTSASRTQAPQEAKV
jgi:cytoskeletal protein CcmA (bactofilin family)